MSDDQRVVRISGGMTERQIIDGIEHICFADPVLSDETIHLR